MDPIPQKLNNEAETTYDSIVGNIRSLYNDTLSDQEAHETTRNLINFCKLLREIEQNVKK